MIMIRLSFIFYCSKTFSVLDPDQICCLCCGNCSCGKYWSQGFSLALVTPTNNFKFMFMLEIWKIIFCVPRSTSSICFIAVKFPHMTSIYWHYSKAINDMNIKAIIMSNVIDVSNIIMGPTAGTRLELHHEEEHFN